MNVHCIAASRYAVSIQRKHFVIGHGVQAVSTMVAPIIANARMIFRAFVKINGEFCTVRVLLVASNF